MTFAKLAEDCWHDMPTLRKWMAGKGAVTKLLADAVMEVDPDRLEACLTADEYAGYEERLLALVKKRNTVIDGEGFAIAIFLLSVVAAAVISWLIQRWLDNHFPKPQLDEWRKEIAS